MVVPVRAEYLPGGTLSLLQEPPSARHGASAVIVVPPFGSEEVASYRERRWLAGRLAEAGHPTLRIDLPTTGDSAGAVDDPGRLAAWADAIGRAADRMRAEGERVAVLACGLGGLAAVRAASQGAAIDDLALWAVPATGRAAVRRLAALARLQPNRIALGVSEAPPLPAGWLEVGGCVLDAATLEELGAVEPAASALGGVERVLLLARDGVAADSELAEAWRAAGVRVELASGNGYDAMLEHPQRTHPPTQVAERLLAWLAGAPEGGVAASERAAAGSAAPSDAAGTQARLAVPGGTEEAVELLGARHSIFGILSRPERPGDGPCVVLLNAGAQRRTGPNRMWVEASRRWLLGGVACLRVDLPAIGDSDGDEAVLRDDAGFYRPEVLDDVRAVLDELERRGVASRFVLAGLCGGAYASFHLGATDPRVCAVGLLNPQALVWADDLAEQRSARRLRRAMAAQGWKDLVRGEISTRAIVESVRTALGLAAARLLRPGSRDGRGPGREVASVADGLERLRAAGVPVLLAFSGEEPLVADLEADGTRGGLSRWPNASWTDLPGTDHELRPVQAQRAAHAVLDRTVAAGVGPRPSGPPGPSGDAV